MHTLGGLNDAQRRAAEAGSGAVLIVAGPGTGKTKTLTARIAWLLESGRAKPGEIVALTFTNKAAREMRERLAGMLGGRARLPKVCTFHALGRDLLRTAGNDKRLLAAAEQQEIIRAIAKPRALKKATSRELSLAISRAKTALAKPADDPRRLLERYQAALAERDAYDFDDLLIQTFEFLRATKTRRPHYRFVLVDEFQDTSELQYEMLKLLASAGNIFAIGDPNQSIYAFRGAGAGMFARFRADFPGALEIALTQNYRSRPEIITLANAIFPDSPQLSAQVQGAGAVYARQTLNEYSEAAYVLSEIEQGIGGSTLLSAGYNEAREPRDYAVLYRTHRAARVLQRAFAEAGVPYQIAGEGSPYERPEIQAVIAGLRTAEIPGGSTVADVAGRIAEGLGLQSGGLAQFFGMLVQFGSDLAAGLKHLDDLAEQKFYDSTVNAVTLMTVHASKGLEFPCVFLAAAEEGVLPKAAQGDAAAFAEEKRLFYVAATRAKERLEILHTKTRGGEPAELSRFAAGLPEDVLPRTTDPGMTALEKRQEKRRQKRSQTSLF